jgi:lysophospholipase L1-like esterase
LKEIDSVITWENPWLKRGDRLVCFGDSLTAATNGYVRMLTEALQPQGIEVINAGRGGDKTPWAMTRLERDVIARQPAALSVFLGANDAAVGRGCWADEPCVTPEAYRSNLVWMIHLCRLAGLKKFSITPPLWRFEGPGWAEFGDIMAPYCLAARQAADEMHAVLVPADTAFAEEWARHPGHTGLLLTTDGVHLTSKGNQIVADTMLRTWGLSE